jgi:hypothetical protein
MHHLDKIKSLSSNSYSISKKTDTQTNDAEEQDMRVSDWIFVVKSLIFRQVIVWLVFLVLVVVRFNILGSLEGLVFDEVSNPASWAESKLTRALTYALYHYYHFILLVFPCVLSADYSKDSIQLVHTFRDSR